MKRMLLLLALASTLCLLPMQAWAVAILYDWSMDVNGTLYQSPDIYMAPAPDGEITGVTGFPTFSAIDPNTGELYEGPEAIGTVTVTYDPGVGGDYYVESFFDVEIDSYLNTFFNESGDAQETPSPGEYGFADDDFGDIAWVLGWDFTLTDTQYALVMFDLSDVEPSGFHLWQTDDETNETVYLSSTLEVRDHAAPIPEPATIVLLGTGLVGLVGLTRKRRQT